MSPESRKQQVDDLFSKIALIAQIYDNDHTTRDELIKPLSEQLWLITQQQELLHELDHLRSNQSLT